MAEPNDQPQEDILLDHNYDGIQEYDNPLPRWWVYIFYVTILFVPIYYFAPGTMGAKGTKERLYADEMETFRRDHPEPPPSAGATSEGLLALVRDEEALEEGKQTYAQNCAACHGPAGGGMIGPNLTDDAWLHGGQPMEIHHTVAEGVLAKGMPPWGKMLKPRQLDAVVAYVISLHGTNPPGAKAPEGTPVSAAGSTSDASLPPAPPAGT
jgi:cytochrome c oxidase cbb3-type subunit 3